MGHVRLGSLPRTRQWQDVIGLIAYGAEANQVAQATISAAEKNLSKASNDTGLIEIIWLLTQLPLAARKKDFPQALRDCGLEVSNSPSLMEIVAAFTDAVDSRMDRQGGRSDLGEIALMSAAESIASTLQDRTQSLFGTTGDDVKRELAKLATNKQFSGFSRDFFAKFTNRILGYFVSRTLPDHVGENERFATLAESREFSAALKRHCEEASKIVEVFSGDWFSKTNWEKKGINRESARGFTHVAMKKITAELKEGAKIHGE